MIWTRVGEEWRMSSYAGEFVISIIGTTASEKPVLWELTGPESYTRSCDSVTEAKAAAEVWLAIRQERGRIRALLKKLQAEGRRQIDIEEALRMLDPKLWKSPSRRGKKRIVRR